MSLMFNYISILNFMPDTDSAGACHRLVLCTIAFSTLYYFVLYYHILY